MNASLDLRGQDGGDNGDDNDSAADDGDAADDDDGSCNYSGQDFPYSLNVY